MLRQKPRATGRLVTQDYRLASQFEIARIFGDPFAQQLAGLEPGGWTGPIYSGYGGHLVQVSAKQPAYLPELAEIRDQVEREFLAERRRELKDTTYQKLLENYEIVVEDYVGPATAATSPESVQAAE